MFPFALESGLKPSVSHISVSSPENTSVSFEFQLR